MAYNSDIDSSSLLSSVPSSPLSSLGGSPSPPPELQLLSQSPCRSRPYPSPPASQQASHNGSPSPENNSTIKVASAKDGPPPAKRRRISKERLTGQHLDLRAHDVDPEQQQHLDLLMEVLHTRQKIVVIAGAGISVSAGIPDFRSSHGLFRSLKDDYKLKGSGKHLFDASVYRDDISTSSFHDMVSNMSRLTKDAKPTAFHHMLATIAEEGRLLRLYTQNVDGIDTSLDPLKTNIPLRKCETGKWPRTVQLHGGLDKMVCSKCLELSDLDASLFTGPVPPTCSTCEEINDIRTRHEGKRSHGIGKLRPRMVLYNEHNPDDEAIGDVTHDDLRKRPDAVIVVGTTLKVPGVRRIVREMCGVVRSRRGGVSIWINNDPPPVSKDLEDCWDIIVRGTSDTVADRAAMRKWNEPALSESFAEISDETIEKASQKTLLVQLPPKCDLEHASLVPLPSELHKNNSFSPPLAGELPSHNVGVPPTDWSPMRPEPIFRSIELDPTQNENVADDPTGLLTPTKSHRGSPSSKREYAATIAAPASAFINFKLSAGNPTKHQTKAAAAKSNKTSITATATKSKAKAGPKPKPKAAKPQLPHRKPGRPPGSGPRTKILTDVFSQSKNLSPAVSGKKLTQPITTASKLSQMSSVFSATAEPMHPVSLQDPRNNSNPSPLAATVAPQEKLASPTAHLAYPENQTLETAPADAVRAPAGTVSPPMAVM